MYLIYFTSYLTFLTSVYFTIKWDFSSGSMVKNPPAMQKTQETQVQSLALENPLEEGIANHTSILAWKTPWTEELGGLLFTGSQRVRQDGSN